MRDQDSVLVTSKSKQRVNRIDNCHCQPVARDFPLRIVGYGANARNVRMWTTCESHANTILPDFDRTG